MTHFTHQGDCKMRFHRVFLLFFGVILTVLAQLDTGTITGTVHDTSGAVVPNVTVTIRSAATDQTFEMKSNEQGIYVSPPLRPGEYTVTIAADGFEKAAKRLQVD